MSIDQPNIHITKIQNKINDGEATNYPKTELITGTSVDAFRETFLKFDEKKNGTLDKEKISSDVDTFLEYELSNNPELTDQIRKACSELGVNFEEFKKSAHDYAMVFANVGTDNHIYNEMATSLANYHCMHMNGSYHRVRHLTTKEWLQRVDPETITDCGYSVPSDYMLDKEFITDRKIHLIEGSHVGEKVSRVIFGINDVPTKNISFESQNMNNFEYVGDSDAYVFLDSIEHASDPDKYLKVQVSHAKNGSYFIFSIPVGPIDSLKEFHFKEWKTDEDAKNWVKENGLRILDSKLAIPNPDVDIFARPIIGGFHNILLLCKKDTSYETSPENYIDGQKKFFTENPEADKPTKLMLNKLAPLLVNAEVADIGCGDAQNLDFYLASGVKHINLIDPSENILSIGRERVKIDGVGAGRTDFQIGDFENNELKDESMDIIISRFSMHYNINMAVALENAYRKLKTGGKLFIIAPHPDDSLNQKIFDKNGKKYIRINLYGSFIAEYPVHKMEEYFSDFVKTNFNIVENKTFTYSELGLEYKNSNNAVLYIQLQKK